MTVTLVLHDRELSAAPGQEALTELSLLNSGTIVEQFAIEIIGLDEGWARAEPPTVSLFPGDQETVVLHFEPPLHPGTAAGVRPWAVRVVPTNARADATVEEGRLTVERLIQVTAGLVPEVGHARLRAKQTVAVDNWGNLPIHVDLAGKDPAGATRISFKPAGLDIPPGQTRVAKMKVKPLQRILKGPMRHRAYDVEITPEGQEEPVTVSGALVQKPLLPRGSVGIGAIAAVVALWLLLVQPAIKSTAVQGANKVLTQQNAQNQALSAQVASVNQQVKTLGSTTTTTTTTTTSNSPPPSPVAF